MKLKSKLILAAASLMVLSGAAAGTSAFAWFTANTNAYASFTSANVQSHMEDLTVKVVSNVRNTLTSTTTDPAASLALTSHAGVIAVPDVSYDATGNVFDRPVLTDKTGTNFSGVSVVENPVNIAAATSSAPVSIFYHEVQLQFNTTDPEIDTGVFLDKVTTFLDKTGASASNLSKAYRVGIFSTKDVKYSTDYSKVEAEGPNTVVTADKLLALYAPYRTVGTAGSGQEQAKYLPSTGVDTAKTLAENYAAYSNGTAVVNKFLGVDNFTGNNRDADFDITTASYSTANGLFGYLGKAGNGGTDTAVLNVIMRIWIEGTDSLAINASIADDTLAEVSAKLSFIGVNTNSKTIA